jgi:hypothetical protein
MEDTEKKPSEKPTVPRSATELQKLKLEKLMKDPVSRNSVTFLFKVVGRNMKSIRQTGQRKSYVRSSWISD